MSTHWTNKRASRVLLGQALARRGWTLYGWSEDDSDPMTDYYAPEHWAGVATYTPKPGLEAVVAVVGASARDSGRQETRQVRETGGICANTVTVREEYVRTWPHFEPNRRGKTWHVELRGMIYAEGIGADTLVDVKDRDEARARADELAGRITIAAERATAAFVRASERDGASAMPSAEVEVREGRNGNLEVRFETKPDGEIRAELKAAGWHWAPSNRCWYGPAETLPARYRHPEVKPP